MTKKSRKTTAAGKRSKPLVSKRATAKSPSKSAERECTGAGPKSKSARVVDAGLLLGSHLSIAGGMTNAIREAEGLGLATVQVFTKNQQQWNAKPLDESAIRDWHSEQERMGWTGRTISHASYLINLASPDDALWRKSIDLMRDEIERCEQLGIAFLVHHPGAFTASSLDEGLRRIATAYRELFASTPGYRTVSCLENTAGAGTTIGRTFDELARLRSMIVESTGQAGRIGYCIDTCHAHAAGYDLSTAAGARSAFDELDRLCGFAQVRVLHLNDSKAPAGSKLDRHEHIGRGTIGSAGFAEVLNRQALRGRPMILETPKGDRSPGEPWDAVNRDALLSLLAPG
ncbi:MAG: deoxyribonuclease IV [Phycisphaeraceae bacterium]|nr:deoxyribonuclease IV [Phycisphaeraceae bacterium]